MRDIDLVYTWVDGSCSDHQSQRAEYARDPKDLNPERFRDNFEMLRYSLRSAVAFAPWLRRIHIVAQRPQVPSWLNSKHSKIQVVFHDQLWEQLELLPNFNSNAIESFLHRIPGLAEHWLYFNDDYFFGAPLSVGDLFDSEGRPKLLGMKAQRSDGFLIWLLDQRINPGWIEHAPNLISTEYWRKMLELDPELVESTRRRKFRSNEDARFHVLYRQYLHKQRAAKLVPGHQQVKFVRLHRIDNRVTYQRRELAAVKGMRPLFFCLNDDQGADPHPQVEQMVRGFLADYYPVASSFEVTS